MKFTLSATRLMIMVVAVLALPACVSKKKYQEALTRAAAEKSALESQIAASQAENDKLKADADKLQSNLNMKQDELIKVSEQIKEGNQKIGALQNAIREVFQTYDSKDVTVEERNGKLYITLSNAVLYEPGSAKLAASSGDVINKLAEVIKRNPGLNILVEGHTDNVPIEVHKKQFPDNWSLSVARSLAVVRDLEKAGVDPTRLTASGKGETQPIASNETEEGQNKNRRTEFIVVPKVDGLYRLYNSNFSGTGGSMK